MTVVVKRILFGRRELLSGLKPYKVGGTHRHTPEIEQELARMGAEEAAEFLRKVVA